MINFFSTEQVTLDMFNGKESWLLGLTGLTYLFVHVGAVVVAWNVGGYSIQFILAFAVGLILSFGYGLITGTIAKPYRKNLWSRALIIGLAPALLLVYANWWGIQNG